MQENTLVNIDIPKLSAALRNKAALDFVQECTVYSYKNYCWQHTTQVERKVNRIFNLLQKSQQNGFNTLSLEQAVHTITQKILHKKDPKYWFNRYYLQYKSQTQPRTEFSVIKNYIGGPNVLDLGSGSGYLALELTRRGYVVTTADVIDYRIDFFPYISFRLLSQSGDLDFENNYYQTIILRAVLHHMSDETIISILNCLKKYGKNLLIKEDIVEPTSSLQGYNTAFKNQPLFRKYMSLPENDRYDALVLIDFIGNTIVTGVLAMNLPFNFKPITTWESILKNAGWRVRNKFLSGFETSKMHQNCQVWLLAE